MPVQYSAAVKTARMTATRDANANGTIEILAGAVVVATLGLSASGGTVSGNAWTAVLDETDVQATADGTIDSARFKNSGGSDTITGLTVGLSGSGADVIVDNTSLLTGQTFRLTSVVLTHAADPA